MKASGYEGSEKDFRDTYRTDESISRLFSIAKQKEMFSGDEEQFIQKYFPSKSKPSKEQQASFDNRFSPFAQKKNLGGTTSSPTKLPSQESVKPKEYTKPSEKTNIFGGTFKEPSATPPEGTVDLGASKVDIKKLSEKKQTESEKVRAEVYKKNGKTAGRLYDIKVAGDNAVSAFTNRAINIPADALNAVAAGAKALDDAAVYLGVKEQSQELDEYATRQAAVGIRKFANDIAPQNPDFQDDLVNVLAGTAPDMIAAVLTGGTAKAAAYFGSIGFGQGTDNAYNAYTEMDKDLEGYIAQRAQSQEDADLLREGYKKWKESGDSPFQAALKVGVKEFAVSLLDVVPMAKYFNKLNKFTGGVAEKVAASKGGQFLEQLMRPLDSFGGRVATQGFVEGTQEIIQTALSNLNAASSYDASRKVTDGMYQSGEAGGVMGMMMQMMLGHKVNVRNQTTDPVEKAIIDADVEYLENKKAEFDANPEAVVPESKEKQKLADALEEDISPEAAKIISKKLEALDDPKEDKGELAPIIERQYKEKIDALKTDMESLPDEAKSEVKKRIDELEAEKKEAIDRVYPDGVKAEAPKKKTLKEKIAEQKAKEAETLKDKLQKAREKEAEKVQDEKVEIAKEEQVQQKPEVPEVKGVDKVEDALELEKEAKLKEVGKPEVKMEFIQKKDLRKAKDIEGASKEHRRVLEEHKQVKSLLDCLWA